ncbi:LysR family transcriptional regulator [Paenibacillus eucommiae]|uniref:DNA-binding transcriptional LysR family regulator n=1 Tax=Paenibacillus eucommiae TaxID=1355755 RepID=A0ABS4J428_9BACL|nr:LysR family transcriptional regulator [Paenibacillus eucommiae]MBP1994560.1 DNA-binding transcriptional LysR family regulator [Paenibacillus eucommiae]
MDVRQLSYFLEVAEQASFSKAGHNLHLSQPTLSKMVKSLEEELDVLLFDRSTRRIHLTDAGEVVQAHAQIIMKALENLRFALTDVKEMKKGKFTLGLPPVIGASFFPKIIAGFHKQYPQITIQLVEEGGKLIEQSLLEGSIDLGVTVLPVDEELFEVVPLVQRELMLVLNAKHPLAESSQISLLDLQKESFILFRKGFALHDRVREACVRNGFEPNVTYESTQWDMISEMVAADLGISLLPETICKKLDASQISAIRMNEPKVHWNLAIIWRKHQYLSHASRGWIRFVRDSFEPEYPKSQLNPDL